MPAILTAAVPLLSVPVPKGLMLRSIFESVELVEIAPRIGPVPVAAFVILSSLTGVPTSVKTRFSSPPASAINPPDANFGEVKILFVSVSAPVKEAKLSLCKAVLNSANEPDKVLVPKSIDLFVKVVVEVAVTKADVASTIFGLVASSAVA